MKRKGIDWLELEREIRVSLEAYKFKNVSAKRALEMISDSVGEYTGRGYILDREWEREDDYDSENI